MAKQRTTIESSLNEQQVFQRNKQNKANIEFKLTHAADGAITGKIIHKGKALRGLSKIAAGKISNGKALCRLKNIPCGGPYTIELSLGSKKIKTVKNIFVGDLWVMGGQSNMQGVGVLRDAIKAHPLVQMFSMRDQWSKAVEPINFCPGALDKVYHGQDKFRSDLEDKALRIGLLKGVGPALSFANYLSKHFNIPIGLIPCAKGGSAMHEWDPALKLAGGDSLYGACLRRIEAAGGKIKGMIWSQGCSDASHKDAQLYTRRMENLIANLSNDLQQAIPWIMTQINGFYDTNRHNLDPLAWTSIRQQQFELETIIPNVRCVTTVDLDLDDGIHISAKSQHRVGQRLAKAATKLCGYDKQETRSPYIASISSKRGNQLAQTDFGSYAIKIAGHSGDIHAPGERVLGFSLRDDNGNECQTIYKAWIHEQYIILQTELKSEELKEYKLYYGFGTVPLCNIVDDNDMALMASGPYDLSTI